MINFKIKIANIVVEVNAFNESTKKYCSDFLCEEDSNYVITMTMLAILILKLIMFLLYIKSGENLHLCYKPLILLIAS